MKFGNAQQGPHSLAFIQGLDVKFHKITGPVVAQNVLPHGRRVLQMQYLRCPFVNTAAGDAVGTRITSLKPLYTFGTKQQQKFTDLQITYKNTGFTEDSGERLLFS